MRQVNDWRNPRTKKVLIVDDDPDLRLRLGEELRDAGCAPLSAADGLQALMMARRERPDLILLDMRLPAGDGLAILARLKSLSETSFIPVIVLTGLRSEEKAERALELGAVAYINKSLLRGDLWSAIRSALGLPE